MKWIPALLTLGYQRQTNMRLAASHPFRALLVWLHNSCPVDALEFWQIFDRSILKDLWEHGG